VTGERAIHVEGLTKYFGAVIGVEELSFEVERGEIYGFLGANGAGKTTTIRLLLDLLRPTRGRATVLGLDCRRQSLEARRQIGYLPGDFPVYPDLTAEGYLDYLSKLDGRRVSRSYLDDLLTQFDVSEIDLRRRLREQSHGMKQKIGIIQALMGRAPILILDEPTAGLDPLMVQAFRHALDALKKTGNTTVFLSSHVLAEVEAICDRIGVIRAGRMVATGTIEDLKRSTARRLTVEFREPVGGTMPPLAGVELLSQSAHQWVLSVRGPLGPIVQALAAYPIHDITVEPFKLEDYVARHYAED
jgi:beta-exotoxin I transport system ATP-binding protein